MVKQNPVMVLEAAVLQRVGGEPERGRGGADLGNHLGQAAAHRGRAGRQVERIQRGLAAFGRAGGGEQRAQRVGEPAAERGDGGGVLVVDRLAQRRVAGERAPVRGAHRGRERRHGEGRR